MGTVPNNNNNNNKNLVAPNVTKFTENKIIIEMEYMAAWNNLNELKDWAAILSHPIVFTYNKSYKLGDILHNKLPSI